MTLQDKDTQTYICIDLTGYCAGIDNMLLLSKHAILRKLSSS